MGFFRGMKRVLKPLVDFRPWMGTKEINQNWQTIKYSAKQIVRTPTPRYQESFEEAVIRYNLTQADLWRRERRFKTLAIVFSIIGLSVLIYAIRLLVSHQLMNFILSISLSLLAFAQAFHYHFWWFQTHKRKLGCGIKEWLRETLGWEKQE